MSNDSVSTLCMEEFRAFSFTILPQRFLKKVFLPRSASAILQELVRDPTVGGHREALKIRNFFPQAATMRLTWWNLPSARVISTREVSFASSSSKILS